MVEQARLRFDAVLNQLTDVWAPDREAAQKRFEDIQRERRKHAEALQRYLTDETRRTFQRRRRSKE
jgi:hypothetical protein